MLIVSIIIADTLKGKCLHMQKENISLLQLLVLVFIFLLGSSIIMGVGTGARQDAWLAILMATFIGIGLMYFYYTLNRLLPNKNLFEIMEYCLSRPIAIFFSIAYILYFFYITCRLLRDFAELISSAILVVTPIEVITLSLMLVIAYILYLGLEVLGRVSEIFAPYLIGFLLLLILFLMGSGELDFRNLQPILGEGFKPIMNEVFPSLITFPFGELIVFTVVLSHVTEFKKGKKVVLMGVLLAGIFLMTGTVVMLLVLGTESIQITNFPLLSAARKISIGEFIERTDAIVVFIMMLGVLVKCSIFFLWGTKGT